MARGQDRPDSDLDLLVDLAEAHPLHPLIRNLIVIGEAVKNLSWEIRDTETATPWKPIAGMWDVLLHDYLRVKLEQVWETVVRDLPPRRPTMPPLDLEEQEILAAYEAGTLRSVATAAERSRLESSARATQALQEGIPHPTLISRVLHKDVNGRLLDRPGSGGT